MPKLVINHIDGNKSNNNLKNLELITSSENQRHAYRIGCKTVKRGNAKISWKVIDECHITNVAVLPEYRNKKIASMLIKKMVEICK